MRRFSTLQIALGLSVAVHAALVTVRFVDPESFNRVFKDTPLEVVLVNAKSNERPDKAQAIAQASLAGGGDLDKGRATTPLPPSALTDNGEAADDAQRRIEAMQEQQTLLLAQIRQQLAAMPPQDPRETRLNPESMAREERRRQLIKLLAEIERRINEQNAKPRKRYISPSTREEAYAVYYDALRRRIEDRGTENFPEAQGRKLYGELTMIVTVNFDGRVLATEVVESSGSPVLDRRAQAIARSAAPFGRFSAAMRRRADQIVVVSRFKFTRDETLETRLTQRS
ncbi:MAG: TonB family protein [Burkholderiaceae bacterium]|nr:TonB family protein [Burkholderiaceae bacterium]